MSRVYLIFLSIILSQAHLLAQNFENFSAFMQGTSYGDGSFTGDNSFSWYYIEAKGGQTVTGITDPAVCLNKSASACLYSDSIEGGCQILGFWYEQEYTTTCNASVYINELLIGTLTTAVVDSACYFYLDNINVCDDFVLKILQNSSSAGQLTIDSLMWEAYNCATVPGVVQKLKVDNNIVYVYFSKSLTDCAVENFICETYINSFSVIDASTISITFPELCTDDVLQISGLTDTDGLLLRDTSIAFHIEQTPQSGDIVINEIMADPSPVVDLPECEYIELYNTSSCSFTLSDWQIHVSGTVCELPEYTLQVGEYVVITKDSAMQQYGNCIITSLPLLNNSGAEMGLYANDALISYVNYDQSWYDDTFKEEGGWSLEKIDYESFDGGEANWQVSVDVRGGTPDAENSVYASNPDTIPPIILTAYPLDSFTICVIFDEIIANDSLQISGLEVDSLWSSNPANTVYITLTNPLEENVIYELTIKNLVDYDGNTADVEFEVALPIEKVSDELLLNEVLFNPYPDAEDFVELYNNSESVIDLAELYLGNCDLETDELNDFSAISDIHYLLYPGEFALISENISSLKENYICGEDALYISTTDIPSYTDAEGCVLLLNKQGERIEEFRYSEDLHHQLLADPEGVSLERISYSDAVDDPNNWHSASSLSGFATPGYENSQYVEYSASDNVFNCETTSFSPNNDGYMDNISIQYNLSKEGYLCTVKIFNKHGYLVRTLYNNELLGQQGSLIWEGNDDDGNIVPTGIYIIKCALFHEDGDTENYKIAVGKM